MSYRLYQTECLVLGGVDSGEADKFIYLFTKEFGLLGAKAKSVRRMNSKLRYSLQSHSLSDVSLVRGRDVWRLVGARGKSSLRSVLSEESFQAVSRSLHLVKKLLPGEEKIPGLYETVLSPFYFLAENDLAPGEVGSLECLAVLRILKKLGYVGDMELDGLASGGELNRDVLTEVGRDTKKILSRINMAIKASNL